VSGDVWAVRLGAASRLLRTPAIFGCGCLAGRITRGVRAAAAIVRTAVAFGGLSAMIPSV